MDMCICAVQSKQFSILNLKLNSFIFVGFLLSFVSFIFVYCCWLLTLYIRIYLSSIAPHRWTNNTTRFLFTPHLFSFSSSFLFFVFFYFSPQPLSWLCAVSDFSEFSFVIGVVCGKCAKTIIHAHQCTHVY